jgi:hypothetical protein
MGDYKTISMKKIKALWIFSIGFILVNIIVYATRIGGEDFLKIFSDILPIICSLIASICLFQASQSFKRFDFAKLAWLLLFIGVTLNFTAEALYSFFEIILKKDMNELFPFIPDYFWCAGYIPLFIGLMIMFFGYKNSGFPMGNTKLYFILSIALLVGLSAVIYYYLIPIIQDPETDTLAKIFYLYYPIGDIFCVIPSLILIYITSLFGAGKISRPWKYLALGFICFTLGDLTYSYLSWKDLYGSGNFIDLSWHIGYLLIALAGLYQKDLIESFNTGGVK